MCWHPYVRRCSTRSTKCFNMCSPDEKSQPRVIKPRPVFQRTRLRRSQFFFLPKITAVIFTNIYVRRVLGTSRNFTVCGFELSATVTD